MTDYADLEKRLREAYELSGGINSSNGLVRLFDVAADAIASLSRDLEEAREWKRVHPCSCEFSDDVDNPEAIRLCFYHQAREREVLEARTIAIRSRQDAYNALTACRPIVSGLIDAEYNIETWGLRGRLAAIDAALASGLSRAEPEDQTDTGKQ